MAPSESIWLQSAADGLLASTTSAVRGWSLVQLEDLGGRAQRAEVEERDLRAVRVDGRLERVDGHVGLHEIKVRVLGDEDAQSERDEILEPCRDHGWHRAGV